MSLLERPLDPADPHRLALEAVRACDRLRSMSLVRLSAALPEGSSRARAAVALAQELADDAADLAGREHRALPELPDPAAGDVLAVCVQDLLGELRLVGASPRADAVCARAVAALISLRHGL